MTNLEQPSIATIPLSKGYEAIVDLADYDRVSALTWHAFVRNHTVYAVSKRVGYMHRFILGNPSGDVDHENHNGIDNRRANLRVCTRSENLMNAKKRPGKTSKYKGVSWVTNGSKWQAQIMAMGAQKYIGYFKNEEDAARAYDAAAKLRFGEYANLNFKEVLA